jgi:hypothetical protein
VNFLKIDRHTLLEMENGHLVTLPVKEILTKP